MGGWRYITITENWSANITENNNQRTIQPSYLSKPNDDLTVGIIFLPISEKWEANFMEPNFEDNFGAFVHFFPTIDPIICTNEKESVWKIERYEKNKNVKIVSNNLKNSVLNWHGLFSSNKHQLLQERTRTTMTSYFQIKNVLSFFGLKIKYRVNLNM